MIRMMITDDEAYEREILTELMDTRFPGELQIRTTENGRKAVELAAVWNPEVVLMDIEMPGLNGLEAARRILVAHPGAKIIFITAYSLFHYAQEAVRLGACDFILKPVDQEEVISAVKRAMGQSQAQQQLQDMASDLPGDTSGEKTDVLMEKVQKHLQYNYMMYDISLDSISEMLNMNPSYFSTLFKRSCGVGFVDYLTDLRIRAAKDLLKDPLRSAAEIAEMVGYESPNYFARAFKKRTGMTPTEYRRHALLNESVESL